MHGVVEGDSEPHAFIPHLVALAKSGELPLERLITRFSDQQFDAAWSAARTGPVLKPVLVTEG